jgi:2-polyprenyl-3-methyl-5-hydroxy-6-metoxy-1,4-benzoquinol methylase
MVHHSVCPLCSSEKIGLLFICKDHFISKKDFGIFQCSTCTFLFTQDYPEEADIARFYESESYISHSDTSEGLSNKLYRVSRNIMLRIKKNHVSDITGLTTGSVLDIGSGTGYFAATMKKAGWHAEGIEINEKAREFSRSRFGLEAGPPDKIASLESGSFDCITLWHVLEHFHDPFKYVSEIYRLLKPEGFFIIALPNSSSYDAGYYKRFWAAWDVPRHLWHFCPETFRLFSGKTGFRQEKMKTLPLDVFYISMLSEKYKGSVLSFIKGITVATLFAFLSLFNKSKSSSIIYILRKF